MPRVFDAARDVGRGRGGRPLRGYRDGIGSLYTETEWVGKRFLNTAAFVLSLETANLVDFDPSRVILVLLAGFSRAEPMRCVPARSNELSRRVQKW